MDGDALSCVVDDFCNAFEAVWRSRMVSSGGSIRGSCRLVRC